MVKGGSKGGVCMAKGGVCGEGGVCMAKRGCVWQRGVCMVCTPPFYEIPPVNARAVHPTGMHSCSKKV